MPPSTSIGTKTYWWMGGIAIGAIIAIILAAVLNDGNVSGNSKFYFLVSPKGFTLGCTNLTGPAGTQKVKEGYTLDYYNSCPRPKSPCESALCTAAGECVTVLSPGSTCASSADCATQYADSSVACDMDTCTCIAQPCCDWIDFAPANYSLGTNNTVVNTSASSFKYRLSATHIEMNGRIEFTTIESTGFLFVTAFNTFDISNIGVNLLSTGSYWGTGVGGMKCQNNSDIMKNVEIYSQDATTVVLYMRFAAAKINPLCSFSFAFYSIIT